MGIASTSALTPRSLARMFRFTRIDPFPDIVGTYMARDAFRVVATALRLAGDDTVLLPAYLCPEVLRPFASVSKVRFYGLERGLAIDPHRLRRMINSTKPRAVVMIDYFGFLQPARREIRRMCDETGVVLIEDCAHSLLTDDSGASGHISIFSFRKTLPTVDGGGYRSSINTRARFYPRIVSNLLSIAIVTKSLLNIRTDAFSRAAMSPSLAPQEISDYNGHSRPVLPMSSISLSGVANADFNAIIDRRRRNYAFWKRRVDASRFLTAVMPDLADGVCPLGFPVRLCDRDSVRQALRRRGVYLETHWNIPSWIGEEHPSMAALSSATLTLPVDQTLNREHCEHIGDLLDHAGRACS